MLKRLVAGVCSTAHAEIFETLYRRLSPELKQAVDKLLSVPVGEQRSAFYQLKEYPPSARVSWLRDYLRRYRMPAVAGIDELDVQFIDAAFSEYVYKLAKQYSAKELKRFADHKRYASMDFFRGPGRAQHGRLRGNHEQGQLLQLGFEHHPVFEHPEDQRHYRKSPPTGEKASTMLCRRISHCCRTSMCCRTAHISLRNLKGRQAVTPFGSYDTGLPGIPIQNHIPNEKRRP